jgi:hypothetical protein
VRPSNLKTSASIARDHGHGIVVVINGVEWSLTNLNVVDRPEDLALCDGYTSRGDLVVFDAEAVELVRIPVADDGRRAALSKYRGE